MPLTFSVTIIVLASTIVRFCSLPYLLIFRTTSLNVMSTVPPPKAADSADIVAASSDAAGPDSPPIARALSKQRRRPAVAGVD